MNTRPQIMILVSVIAIGLMLGTGCSDDDEDNPTTPNLTVSTDAAANEGLLTTLTGANSVTASGTWTNNTFSSTGNFMAEASFVPATNMATFIFDIDGGVYGGADPAAETFNVDLSDFIANGTADINVTSATYGDVSMSLTFYTNDTGTFAGTAINEPSGNVTDAMFSGTFEIDGGAVTLELGSASFNYNGTPVTMSNSFSLTLN
nr:hypothetical protein [Candidatus Krumholzibacteria bacterium]